MIDKLAKFKDLKTRQKLLIIGLAIVIGFSFYFNALYKPLSRKITRYKFQIEKSTSRLNEVQTKFPQIEKQKQNIHSLNAECQSLLDEITEIEKTLSSTKNTSQLLTELTRQTKGLKIISITS